MTTLLLALALVSGLTPAETASEPGPGTPAPAVEPAASALPGPDAAARAPTPEPGPGAPAPAAAPAATPLGPDATANSPRPSALEMIETVALVEGVLVLGSALTAGAPEGMGWVLLSVSPGAYWFGGGAVGVAAALTVFGVGTYNVFELSGDRYTYSDRFWLNMAAWHAGIGVVALAIGLAGRQAEAPASTTPQVSLGLTPGGGALLVAGRF